MLWDTETLSCLRIFNEHKEGVDLKRLVTLSPQIFASASHDIQIKIWNIDNEKSILTIDLEKHDLCEVTAMVGFDARRLIAAHDKVIVIWDVYEEKIILWVEEAHDD
jgi:WD40 repeat protein